MGFVYGTVTIFQYGAGTAGVMRTLGKFMVGSGSMFAYVDNSKFLNAITDFF